MARILVVDEPATGAFMLQLLRPLGHQVVAAADGRDGLTKLMRRHFDLVLLDARGRGIQAIEFLDRLHGMPGRSSTRVLILHGRHEGISPALRARADVAGGLARPFLSLEVLHVVRDALRRLPVRVRSLVQEAQLFEEMVELQEGARTSEDTFAPIRPTRR